jgi:predicted transcriptional regulator
MTKLLEMAVEAARQLSPDEQDELARTILEIVNGIEEEVYVLSDEERAAIEVGRAQAARGEFATEDEIEAIFKKYTS